MKSEKSEKKKGKEESITVPARAGSLNQPGSI